MSVVADLGTSGPHLLDVDRWLLHSSEAPDGQSPEYDASTSTRSLTLIDPSDTVTEPEQGGKGVLVGVGVAVGRALTVTLTLSIIGSLRSKPTQGWILSFSVCALITLGITLALFYQATTSPELVGFGQFLALLSLIGTLPGAGFFIWLCTWVADYERDIRYGDKVISLTKRPSR